MNDFRRKTIEDNIRNYYSSLSEEEKKEDIDWLKVAEKNAKGLWDDWLPKKRRDIFNKSSVKT